MRLLALFIEIFWFFIVVVGGFVLVTAVDLMTALALRFCHLTVLRVTRDAEIGAEMDDDYGCRTVISLID